MLTIDFRLKDLLFPTLLAACHENKFNLNTLKQEMSPDILIEYTRQILDKPDPGAPPTSGKFCVSLYEQAPLLHLSLILYWPYRTLTDTRTIASKFSKAQWTDFLAFLSENNGTSNGSKAQWDHKEHECLLDNDHCSVLSLRCDISEMK